MSDFKHMLALKNISPRHLSLILFWYCIIFGQICVAGGVVFEVF